MFRSTSFRVAGAAVIVCLLPALIGGCEAITNAAKLKIPIPVAFTLKADNPSIPFNSEDCTDLSTNTDYNNNKDSFEGATVKDITILVTDLTDPIFTSGTIADQQFTNVRVTMVFDPSYGDTKVYELGTLSNVSLAAIHGPTGGTAMNVPKGSDADVAAALILNRPKFCVRVDDGALNTGPASAKHIEAKVELTINFEASAI
jgi:hypothetical protein